jgi:hypothetical protein
MAKKNKYADAKQRRKAGGFVAMPYAVIRSPQFVRLSPYGVKLLCDMLAQLRGQNNGDLCASWTLMKLRGWRSKDTLSKSIQELRKGGWIETTRQGGRHKATLYAVSFFAIEYCNGKLDVSPTGSPSGAWRKEEALHLLMKSKTVVRQPGQSLNDCPASRINADMVIVN